jgi:MFS family permease
MNLSSVGKKTHANDEHLIGPDGRLSTGWRVVIVSVLAMIVGPPSVLILSFGVFLPEFQAAFGWSIQAISVGATLMSLILVIIAPLQGYVVDRLGCRTLILISMPLFGAGVLCMSLIGPHISMYYIACVLVPIAGLGLWPLTYMKMASTWFDRRLGFALGSLNVGNGLGAAIIPLVLALLFGLFGWRSAYLFLGLINLAVCWPMAMLWLRERPTAVIEHAAREPNLVHGLPFEQAIRSSTFLIIAVGFSVIGVLSAAFLVHQFNILFETGISKRAATFLQSYLGITSIVGQLLVGWLMDRVAAGRIVAGMLALIALACVAYTTSWASALALPCVTVVGFMIGAEMNILGYMIKRYFGERAFGKLYGLIFAVFACGAALGAQILAYSRTDLHSYTPGLLVIATLCLAAAALFMRLVPYRFEVARLVAPVAL